VNSFLANAGEKPLLFLHTQNTSAAMTTHRSLLASKRQKSLDPLNVNLQAPLENVIVPPVKNDSNWMGLVTMSDYFALRAHRHKALR
jgi:hypothetical protein